jgi:hypothetical protein
MRCEVGAGDSPVAPETDMNVERTAGKAERARDGARRKGEADRCSVERHVRGGGSPGDCGCLQRAGRVRKQAPQVRPLEI